MMYYTCKTFGFQKRTGLQVGLVSVTIQTKIEVYSNANSKNHYPGHFSSFEVHFNNRYKRQFFHTAL